MINEPAHIPMNYIYEATLWTYQDSIPKIIFTCEFDSTIKESTILEEMITPEDIYPSQITSDIWDVKDLSIKPLLKDKEYFISIYNQQTKNLINEWSYENGQFSTKGKITIWN